ncbi:hypothetical protein, partial [Sandarakinorhabdus glacialis]|uniref:hypothetical protein n=1 Tax=Sandarakinorhabdus glacialis TaxID=1614636 RepID=UPI001A9C625E
MAGFYAALIGTPPTIHWPALSPPCTRWVPPDLPQVQTAYSGKPQQVIRSGIADRMRRPRR